MALDKYISELLFQHDCVVVPGLGGFITNYKPAFIQPIQNTFYPPSKSISFNKNLINNDGLLANFIAQKENINYDNSFQKIQNYVLEIKKELRLKKRVSILKVGSIYLDTENRIQFEATNQTNYLLESYGLPIFQKQMVTRPTLEEKIVQTIPLTNKEEEKSKKWFVAAAVAIPIIFLAIWIPLRLNLYSSINYADFSPFSHGLANPVYSSNELTIKFDKAEKSKIKDLIALADENTYFLNVSFDKEEPSFIVKIKENTIAKADSTYVAIENKKLRYHIVGGCFSKKSNARKMVQKLKRKNFKASIVGKRKGLWAVGYQSFATRKEALDLLSKAQTHNPKAWILYQ